MAFWNKKPKSVAPVLASLAEVDIITQLNRTIDERDEQIQRDAAHIKIQGQAIAALHEQLEMARAVQASQADTIASQKDTIASLEREVASVRKGNESFERGYEQLEKEIEEYRISVHTLQVTIEGLKRQAEKDAEVMHALSKRAIHLLLFPRGMHQSWKVDREKLLAEYKAVGIEDE